MKRGKASEAAMHESFMTLLERYRKSRGWTQEDLAGKLGVDASAISLWESGETAPSPKRYRKLSRLLGVTPLELTEIIEKSEPAGASK